MAPSNKNQRPVSTYSFTPVPTQDGYDPEGDSTDGKQSDECGIACCHPKWMQIFSRPTVFLLIFCMVGMVQGAFFTYFVGIITTVEKRYAFKSKITGIISIADNLSPVITSLLIGFFGGRGHKTRWIAIGTIIAAFSAFISSLPYFIFGASESLLNQGNGQMVSNSSSTINSHLCGYEEQNGHCNEQASQRVKETIPAIALLFIGNFINGIGSTAFYIVGTPYLDDNIAKSKTPIYFAVMSSLRLVGPSGGFLLSSMALRYYEDPSIEPNIDSKDPRWIGAWWIGFNIIAILLLLLGILLSLFPQHLKWASDKSDNKKIQFRENQELSFKEKLKEFPKSVAALLRNPILMCQNVSLVFYLLGVLGFFLFLPKYFETQFRQPPQSANIKSGVLSIVFMVVGFMLSGILIYKFKPSARFLSGWNVLLGFIQVAALVTMGMLGCSKQSIISGNECMGDCLCDHQIFSPVCHESNSTTYFSPCHAGCTESYLLNGTKVFDDCSCTDEILTSGYCDENCKSMMLYIIIMVGSNLLSSTGRIGNMLVTLRCVNPEDKSLALSTTSFFLSIFAFIPYPLVYGAIVDSVCLEWDTTCGQKGNCWVYDADQFRKRYHGFTAGFFLVGAIFDTVVWYYSKNIKSLYEDPVYEKKNKTKSVNKSNINDAIRYTLSGSRSSLAAFK